GMATRVVAHTIRMVYDVPIVAALMVFSPLSFHTYWLLAIGYWLNGSLERIPPVHHENGKTLTC
ncbi:MAG: hypothetical protein FWE88_07995, partial [Phycisphaerae bacterium]|nr:hypothetical protein [Phycisphaerae bacterium]